MFLHNRLSVFLLKCIVFLHLSCIYLVFRSQVFQGSRAQVLQLCGEILRQCSTTCILRSHLLSLLLMLHLLDSIIIVASPTQFWCNKVSAHACRFSKIVEVSVSDFQTRDFAYWQILDLTLHNPFINKGKS